MSAPLSSTLSPPFALFREWFKQAQIHEINNYNAAALSTAQENISVSCRMVLVYPFQNTQFIFYTNYDSRKSAQLSLNPNASLLFYWKSISKQIRIEGKIIKSSVEESRKYFSTRQRQKQISTWSSKQSQPIPVNQTFDSIVQQTAEKFADDEDIPCPDFWGGYVLQPQRIEFWQEGQFRRHVRNLFVWNDTLSQWTQQTLFP